jgi:hypothetical protein
VLEIMEQMPAKPVSGFPLAQQAQTSLLKFSVQQRPLDPLS